MTIMADPSEVVEALERPATEVLEELRMAIMTAQLGQKETFELPVSTGYAVEAIVKKAIGVK